VQKRLFYAVLQGAVPGGRRVYKPGVNLPWQVQGCAAEMDLNSDRDKGGVDSSFYEVSFLVFSHLQRTSAVVQPSP
jgi:hypothetical protein